MLLWALAMPPKLQDLGPLDFNCGVFLARLQPRRHKHCVLSEFHCRREELLAQVEAMRRARTMVVPTNDLTVRQKLRELGHPITLFGERAPGRRERLRAVMARLVVEKQDVSILADSNAKVFYIHTVF